MGAKEYLNYQTEGHVAGLKHQQAISVLDKVIQKDPSLKQSLYEGISKHFPNDPKAAEKYEDNLKDILKDNQIGNLIDETGSFKCGDFKEFGDEFGDIEMSIDSD